MVLLVFIFSYLYIKIFLFNSHTVESLTNNFWMIMRTFLSFQLNSLINLDNSYNFSFKRNKKCYKIFKDNNWKHIKINKNFL